MNTQESEGDKNKDQAQDDSDDDNGFWSDEDDD